MSSPQLGALGAMLKSAVASGLFRYGVRVTVHPDERLKAGRDGASLNVWDQGPVVGAPSTFTTPPECVEIAVEPDGVDVEGGTAVPDDGTYGCALREAARAAYRRPVVPPAIM